MIFAGAIAVAAALPAHAQIMAEDAYARTANQKTGAAFFQILNHGPADRLIDVRADVARKVEIHTHIFEDGIVKMRQVEDGVPLPAKETVMFERGGLHVMFMGLTQRFEQGAHFPLTLRFESGAELTVDVMIDNDRRPGASASEHGGHSAAPASGHGSHGAAPASGHGGHGAAPLPE
jgi:hypothetical protein